MMWLVEQGIGEERALLIENDQAIAARINWPGELAAGQIEDAVLTSKAKGATRGRARFASGEEALVDRLPDNASEGAPIRLQITRAKIGEKQRVKLAQARPSDADLRPAPSLHEKLAADGAESRIVHKFPGSDWEEIWSEAWDGIAEFTGGSLQFSPTPAMTLIDVDGHLSLRELALAACEPIALAIARMGLAGSIGIDFPTLSTKADRKAVDAALSLALDAWNHERTSMNGFGFVQLVARMESPSLLHRLQMDRTGSAARLLLRRAEDVSDPGTLLLTAHPAVIAALSQDWQDQLARRTGRALRLATDPALALNGGFAQAITS